MPVRMIDAVERQLVPKTTVFIWLIHLLNKQFYRLCCHDNFKTLYN